MRNILAFAVLLLFICQLSAISFGSSASLQANVMVECPFHLSENSLSIYNIGSSITLNYTIYTQAQCTINTLQGSLVLQYSGNNVQVLSDPLVTTAIQSPALYDLPTINSVSLSPDSYRAIVSFSTYGASNESIRSFTLISPVNIILADLSVSPSQASVGLPLTFTMNLVNDGQLASGDIGLNIIINGPQYLDISEPASALSPSQSELVSFMISNDVTGISGSYSVSAYATFTSGGAVLQSNTGSASYYVAAPVTPPAPSQSSSQPVVSVPQLTLSSVPSYSSVQIGSSILSGMSIQNIVGVPETVILSIPQQFNNLFSLAAHSVYLMPNESLQVPMAFNANNTNQTGVYVIPVNISITALNGTPVTRTQYLTYVVQRSSYNVSLYNQISLSQGSATVTTTLVGARNSSLTNATLITTLPGAVVKDASQVRTYGLPATVTTFNGTNMSMEPGGLRKGRLATFAPTGKLSMPSYTIIRWLVPYLPQGKTVTMAYTISNPLNVGLLTSVQNLLVVQSQPAPASILRVVSIQTPTFYENSSNKVTVGVLYTGTEQQDVKFVLSTTGMASITNPVQIVNASPNQFIQKSFSIRTANLTGTLLFTLYISSENASLNYTLPVIVLQNNALPTTTMPQIIPSNIPIGKYAPWIAGVALVCIIAFLIQGIRRRPRYQEGRAKELIRIREQIKRSDEHA